MTITYELDLNNFNAWSGAIETLDRIKREGMVNRLENLLEELYPDGMNETELNDLLRFEDEWIFECLGMRTVKQIKEEIEEKNDELSDLEEDYDYLRNDLYDEFIEETCDENGEIDNNYFSKWLKENNKNDELDDILADIEDIKNEIEELEEEYNEYY